MSAGSVALRNLAGDLKDIPFKAMLPTIKQIKQIAATEGGRMSNVSKRGVKLRAVDRQIAGKAADVVVWRVQGVPVGPWTWRNTGTSAHLIRRRKRGKMRKMTVPHPGTGGSGHWRKVETRAAQIVSAVFADTVADTLRGW